MSIDVFAAVGVSGALTVVRADRAMPRRSLRQNARATRAPVPTELGKTRRNDEIAAALDEIADLLEIQGANPFRIRAYRNAAQTLRGMSQEVSDFIASRKKLEDLPGIGGDLAGKISELALAGKTPLLEQLRREMPRGLTELLHLPALGPKRVKRLHDELKVDSLADLQRAIKSGRLGKLGGFGPKMTERLGAAIRERRTQNQRFPLGVARKLAIPLQQWMARAPGALKATVAGSYRRGRETVGDLDIVVVAAKATDVVRHFSAYPEVTEVPVKGPSRASAILRGGLQVDVRVVPPESYGAALVYFTGSKSHSIALRRRGIERGLKVNEYGVFRGSRRIAGETEQSVYEALGLPFIEPEMREARGELAAAEARRLPSLVGLRDIRGDLHVHTAASDGHNTVREMALAAKALGYGYVAITDHSVRMRIAHGLDRKRLAAQAAEIDRVNRSGIGIAVLKGIEVDILKDGSLDLPDDVLRTLDLVVAAVHGNFELSREEQTRRILAAMDNPHVTVLAHPTGRLLSGRSPYDVDMAELMRKARAAGVALELNADPDRLDLNDVHCRMAADMGVRVAIGSDAHTVDGLGHMAIGITQARRGWLSARDVLNATPYNALMRILRQRKARARGGGP